MVAESNRAATASVCAVAVGVLPKHTVVFLFGAAAAAVQPNLATAAHAAQRLQRILQQQ